MRFGILTLACVLAGSAVVTGCERNNAQEIEKVRKETADEIARIRRETDEKIAAAQREADKKIVEARQEAAKDITEKRQEGAKDIAAEQRRIEAAIKSAKQDTQEGYEEYAKNRMRLLELREESIKAGVAETARADFNKQIADLDNKKKKVESSLAELDKATGDTWKAVKAKVDPQLKELETTIETIDKKF